MAFDKTATPKDFLTSSRRPIDGFYPNPLRNPDPTPALYYPSTVPDSSFLPKVSTGYNWSKNCSPNFGGKGSASDLSSDEGCDDSVSGQLVKFLCSFGGKILPRPSDGALRYVGGQTRIISIRKNVTFGELVQKMTDIYPHHVMIKYQLPDEDLDALVVVSCTDDLENMMDEYKNFTERCSNGSPKLRIFLFSYSDLESSDLVHIGDLQVGEQKYVEAVNGIIERSRSFGDLGCIGLKDSYGSDAASSSQTSDFSGTEGQDFIGNSTYGLTAIEHPRKMCLEANSVMYTDTCSVPLSNHMIRCGPEVEGGRYVPLSVPLSLPVVSFPVPSPYVPAYQENPCHANYVQLPSQMGYPTHMQMDTSFASMRPVAVPTVVQPQQTRLEHYPEERRVVERVLQLPTGQGYNASHAHVLTARQGGSYDRFQLPNTESMALTEGPLPPQFKESSRGILSDPRSVYHSLPLDNQGTPLTRPIVTETRAEGKIEQLARPRFMGIEANTNGIGVSKNLKGQHLHYAHRENIEHSKRMLPEPVMMTSGAQSSCPSYVDDVQNFVPRPQFKVSQDTAINRPYNLVFAPVGGIPLQSTDYIAREGPKNYHHGKISGGVPIHDSSSLALDRLRQIDGRLENLQIRPSTILAKSELNKSILDPRKPESYEASMPPPLHKVNPFVADNFQNAVYSGVESHMGERQDTIPWSQSRTPGNVESFAYKGNNESYKSPLHEVPDNSTPSLFSNQDPWNLRNEIYFPPPRHEKIPARRENVEPIDLVSSNKASAEELIKTELQTVSRDEAASLLHPSAFSNPKPLAYAVNDSPPVAKKNSEVHCADVELQQRDKLEDLKTKLIEKINLGIPASDSIGRLQIIKNIDLEELRELGVGTIGTVYHGKWRGTDVAIKRVNDRCFSRKPADQERMRDDFWNEAIKLADLHHPNVVAFYGVVIDGLDDSVATVTEYMVNGSLRNVLQKSDRPLDQHKRILISMDVAFGMEYLHGKNIVHFDLKSDNLLVNLRDPQRPICKVGDLGLSKVKCQTLISGGVRGTLPWMAPELLNGGSSSLVSDKVDVFSFGIVMWELLTGKEPYTDLHYGAIIGGIMSNTLRPPIPETCDPQWRVLMEKCWRSEPSKRPNFSEIANDLRAMASKLPPRGQI